MLSLGSLHRVAHRLDGRIADRMSGNLKPGTGRANHQLPKLGRGRPPGSSTGSRCDPLGSAVDEHLDRAGPHQRAAETRLDPKARRGFEQLPGEKLVPPHTHPPRGAKLVISAPAIRKA